MVVFASFLLSASVVSIATAAVGSHDRKLEDELDSLLDGATTAADMSITWAVTALQSAPRPLYFLDSPAAHRQLAVGSAAVSLDWKAAPAPGSITGAVSVTDDGGVRWTDLGTFPALARYGAAAFGLDSGSATTTVPHAGCNLVCLAGGSTADGAPASPNVTAPYQILQDVYCSNDGGVSWQQQAASLPYPLFGASAAQISDNVWVAGGVASGTDAALMPLILGRIDWTTCTIASWTEVIDLQDSIPGGPRVGMIATWAPDFYQLLLGGGWKVKNRSTLPIVADAAKGGYVDLWGSSYSLGNAEVSSVWLELTAALPYGSESASTPKGGSSAAAGNRPSSSSTPSAAPAAFAPAASLVSSDIGATALWQLGANATTATAAALKSAWQLTAGKGSNDNEAIAPLILRHSDRHWLSFDGYTWQELSDDFLGGSAVAAAALGVEQVTTVVKRRDGVNVTVVTLNSTNFSPGRSPALLTYDRFGVPIIMSINANASCVLRGYLQSCIVPDALTCNNNFWMGCLANPFDGGCHMCSRCEFGSFLLQPCTWYQDTVCSPSIFSPSPSPTPSFVPSSAVTASPSHSVWPSVFASSTASATSATVTSSAQPSSGTSSPSTTSVAPSTPAASTATHTVSSSPVASVAVIPPTYSQLASASNTPDPTVCDNSTTLREDQICFLGHVYHRDVPTDDQNLEANRNGGGSGASRWPNGGGAAGTPAVTLFIVFAVLISLSFFACSASSVAAASKRNNASNAPDSSGSSSSVVAVGQASSTYYQQNATARSTLRSLQSMLLHSPQRVALAHVSLCWIGIHLVYATQLASAPFIALQRAGMCVGCVTAVAVFTAVGVGAAVARASQVVANPKPATVGDADAQLQQESGVSQAARTIAAVALLYENKSVSKPVQHVYIGRGMLLQMLVAYLPLALACAITSTKVIELDGWPGPGVICTVLDVALCLRGAVALFTRYSSQHSKKSHHQILKPSASFKPSVAGFASRHEDTQASAADGGHGTGGSGSSLEACVDVREPRIVRNPLQDAIANNASSGASSRPFSSVRAVLPVSTWNPVVAHDGRHQGSSAASSPPSSPRSAMTVGTTARHGLGHGLDEQTLSSGHMIMQHAMQEPRRTASTLDAAQRHHAGVILWDASPAHQHRLRAASGGGAAGMTALASESSTRSGSVSIGSGNGMRGDGGHRVAMPPTPVNSSHMAISSLNSSRSRVNVGQFVQQQASEHALSPSRAAHSLAPPLQHHLSPLSPPLPPSSQPFVPLFAVNPLENLGANARFAIGISGFDSLSSSLDENDDGGAAGGAGHAGGAAGSGGWLRGRESPPVGHANAASAMAVNRSQQHQQQEQPSFDPEPEPTSPQPDSAGSDNGSSAGGSGRARGGSVEDDDGYLSSS